MCPLCSDVKKMYKKVCCMYRLVVLPSKCIAFLDVFVVVATAPYFDLKGHMEVS